MGRAQIKSSFKKISFIATSLLATLVFAGQSYAATPYFKALGGDVFAGGGFNGGSAGTDSAPCLANFQAPTTNGTIGSPNKGGIMAFVNSSFSGGASAQLGAFALGVVSNDTSANGTYGFLSNNAGTALSFANDKGSANYGTVKYYSGVFQDARLTNAAPQTTHCIPNYYTIKGGSSAGGFPGNFNASGKYSVTGSPTYTLGGITVPANASAVNATLFVTGNLYINGTGIQYAAGYTEANVPKLAVVVKGNIYIDPSVSQLDGFYIAQPTNPNNPTDGNIWTCRDGSATDPTGDWLFTHCPSSLTVNGAFVAKQIMLTRTIGDVSNAQAAEIFNYTPEMVVGGGFFNQTNTFGQVQKLVNLPPIF